MKTQKTLSLPLQTVLTKLESIHTDEVIRRQVLEAELANLRSDKSEDPTIRARRNALIEIVAERNRIENDVEVMKVAYILNEGAEVYSALRHTLKAWMDGFPEWRVSRTERLVELVRERVIKGRHNADWDGLFRAADELESLVEQADSYVARCASYIESFKNSNYDFGSFTRAMETVYELSSIISWDASFTKRGR